MPLKKMLTYSEWQKKYSKKKHQSVKARNVRRKCGGTFINIPYDILDEVNEFCDKEGLLSSRIYKLIIRRHYKQCLKMLSKLNKDNIKGEIEP